MPIRGYMYIFLYPFANNALWLCLFGHSVSSCFLAGLSCLLGPICNRFHMLEATMEGLH